MFGEFSGGETYFAGTLAAFEVGFLTAAMRLYPAFDACVHVLAALDGTLILAPALDGSVEVQPL